MRQVFLHVPPGRGADVARAAADRGGIAVSRTPARNARGADVELVTATVPNRVVEELLEIAEQAGPLEATVPSTSVFSFEPPPDEPSNVLLDVTPRSPVEIVLAGQESAGSWRGFLTFAVTAGMVVWIGLYTETVYLLTAAMLLAPFAGPAMNTALALSSGNPGGLRHAVTRYLAGVAAAAATSGALTAITGQQQMTTVATDVLTLSNVAVLLPLAAGIAGATFLVQSEHSSLVSGAAVGMLVAASLAPPAGGIGMAVALGRTDLLGNAVFVVVLQLVGITLAAAVVFRLYGVTPESRRAEDVREGLLARGLPVVAVGLAALLAFQFLGGPMLQRYSLTRDASAAVETLLSDHPDVQLLDVEARVPTQRVPGDQRLVVDLDVEALDTADGGTIQRLTRRVRLELEARLPGTVPLVEVTLRESGQ